MVKTVELVTAPLTAGIVDYAILVGSGKFYNTVTNALVFPTALMPLTDYDFPVTSPSPGVYSTDINYSGPPGYFDVWFLQKITATARESDNLIGSTPVAFSSPLSVVGETASCIYNSQEEFVLRWGLKNVASVTNKDNTTKDINVPALQQAFDFGVEELHNSFRGSPYVVPFTFAGYGGILSQKIKSWHSIISFCYLYFDRGMDDKSKSGNKFSMLLQKEYDEMGFVRSGLKQIPADVGVSSAMATTPLRYPASWPIRY